MPQLAFWPVPHIENEDVDLFEVLHSTSASGPWASIAQVRAKDNYDNWVTHYYHEAGITGAYYKVNMLESGAVVQESPVKAGETPYAVTPQMVLDTIQGLPFNAVTAEMVHLHIGWILDQVEREIRFSLSEKTATDERYPGKAFSYILGSNIGNSLQLRNFPVNSVDAVKYQIRTSGSKMQTLSGLNIQIEHDNPVTGYNHGAVSFYPTQTSFQGAFAGQYGNILDTLDVVVFITYTYGLTTWPPALVKVTAELAAAEIMEIAGEADTAGLSSRSIDGYSESYTASATTTIFSARRIWYEDKAKKILKLFSKPLWG